MTRNNKFLAVGFMVLAVLVVLNLFVAFQKDDDSWVSTAKASNPKSQMMASAEIIGAPTSIADEPVFLPTATPEASAPSPAATAAPASSKPVFPAVWQRDKTQYINDGEWQTWAPSACSAASLASVLIGYGHPVRITDVLYQFRQLGAIKSSVGLYKYDVFSTVASQYGLKVIYSEDKDLDAHFARVLDFLKQGYPVILNVRDPVYFPDGHFIVATGLNPDGTVAIMNPDPTDGKGVNQNWTQESLKLYFGRMDRSAAVLPQ
ncbi:MAG: C39 family peptidase [Chloroflexi bacterium]|nr:C39 family peptidase [Chloroflexota bacterium]